MQNYVDLHVHTEYTKGNGLTPIPELVQRAKSYGMEALAITDSASIEGFDEFSSICEQEGITPIFGCGFYFTPDSRFNTVDEKYHIVLLAQNDIGLKNLKELVKASEEQVYKRPRIDFDLLENHNDGLIALTGGSGGLINKVLLNGDMNNALSYLARLQHIFGEDGLYLELQDNGTEKNRIGNSILADISNSTGLPMVVSGGSFYLDASDADRCNEVRTASGNGPLNGAGYNFKSPDEVHSLFSNHRDAIENSVRIARRCCN